MERGREKEDAYLRQLLAHRMELCVVRPSALLLLLFLCPLWLHGMADGDYDGK